MTQFIFYLFALVPLTYAQYNPAISPFGQRIAPFAPAVAPNSGVFGPTVAPNVGPFGSTVRPLLPSAYNSQYYNPALAAAVPILTYSNDQNVDGSYAYSFTTADGKQAQESGYLKDAFVDSAGEPQGVHVVQGSYAYTAPDGTPIQVNYVADENGFRPQGVHIPSDGRYAPPAPPPGTPVAGTPAARYDPFGRFGNQYDRFNQYDRYNQLDRYRYNSLGQYNRNDRYNRYNARYNPYGAAAAGTAAGAAAGEAQSAGAAGAAAGAGASPPGTGYEYKKN